LGNLIHFSQRKKTLKKKNRCFRRDQVFVNPNPLSFPLWHQTYISIGGFCQFFTKILCALSFSYISTVVLFMMTNSHSLSRGLKIQLYKYRGDSFSNTCLHHNEVEAPPFRSLGSSSHSLILRVSKPTRLEPTVGWRLSSQGLVQGSVLFRQCRC